MLFISLLFVGLTPKQRSESAPMEVIGTSARSWNKLPFAYKEGMSNRSLKMVVLNSKFSLVDVKSIELEKFEPWCSPITFTCMVRKLSSRGNKIFNASVQILLDVSIVWRCWLLNKTPWWIQCFINI